MTNPVDTWDQAWNAVSPGMQQVLGGETISILRQSSVEPLATGLDPTQLQLANPALLGAVTIDLQLPAAAPFRGVLVAGERITIGGNLYTVITETNVVPGGSLFSAVPVTPGLVSGQSAGTAAVLSGASYTFPLNSALIWHQESKDASGMPLSWDLSMRISLLKAGAPTTPRMDDVLVRLSGEKLRISVLLDEDATEWNFSLGAFKG